MCQHDNTKITGYIATKFDRWDRIIEHDKSCDHPLFFGGDLDTFADPGSFSGFFTIRRQHVN